jgi:dTDP-4-dehydrorhamnose 3,5-epimerase
MPFTFTRLEVPGIVHVEAQTFEDNRGHFLETYQHSAFKAAGIPDVFVQDNLSHSKRGVLRGLHYQMHPRAQGKLVMVLRGEIFDVAVDIRQGSPTYGRWVGRTLSGECCQMLYVPVGFAHGFCVLSQEADVLYKVTDVYAPDLERSICWNDPEIGIRWPIEEPILSLKDAHLPPLREANNNFRFDRDV